MTENRQLEIERKFLVERAPPGLDRCPGEEVVQGYLAVEAGAEVRLRRRGARYFETVKSGEGLVRSELEVELERDQFATLWPATAGKRVEKTRYTLALETFVVELDVYRGTLHGLMTAEVEFASAAAASAFQPPEWFGAEVTDDSCYKNRNLAVHGLPSRP
jgi:CYTH domain-containing protein